MQLRPYQQEAHDAVINHIKKFTSSCVVEAATGAGKSLIIAELAKTIHKLSKGKNILCLAPSAELVTQNREKYLHTGQPASMFSASVGSKCLRHPVVFGTPQTVANAIDKFSERFAAIIIDEAHGITPTIKKIIETMKQKNKMIRVIALSATPYRMLSGYIYAMDNKEQLLSETQTKDPYFYKCVYKITAPYLIDRNYLTKPVWGDIGNADSYETKQMQVNAQGNFKKEDIDKAYHGQGRKTSKIVSDIIGHSRNRKGVMIFAATIQHANEIMDSLPPELSRLVTGETKKNERASILKQFQAQKIKYLVNVAVLTTGFDASHVDVIALMRATESAGLLSQIIGRGLRLHDGKNDCLVLDYAENQERHFPDGDMFNPTILVKGKKEKGADIEVVCPECSQKQIHTARENKEGYGYTKDGYFADLSGDPLEIPSHHGRRCKAYIQVETDSVQCSYRWNGKECPHCNADNDIAARYCTKCKGEIIDPNEKLRLDFEAFKKDPYQAQTDEILDMVTTPSVSKNGNEVYRVNFITPYRNFTVWIQKNPTNTRANAIRDMFLSATKGGFNTPQTVTYKKESSGFYAVLSFNKAIDEII